MHTQTDHQDCPEVDDEPADIAADAMLELWLVSELPVIGVLPKNQMIFCPTLQVRQQIYHIEHPALAEFQIRRAIGPVGATSLRDFIVLDVEDRNHNQFKIAIHPEWIWKATGQFIAPELASWSVGGRAPELCDIIDYALVDVFDFFEWTSRGVSKLNLASLGPPDNAMYFSDNGNAKLVAFGCNDSLNLAELTIRTFSVDYRNRCLWLGQSLLFDLHLYLKLQKTIWRFDELKALELGDLLCLQQTAVSGAGVNIRARVISHSACSVQWSREVYFKMTENDSKIRMGDEAWSQTWNTNQGASHARDQDKHGGIKESHEDPEGHNAFSIKPHQVVEGMSGPEDVVLEVLAGVTQVNFNELCNIQEGSLIELQTHTLPMVRLAVRGVPILEGELVRFKDTVMVQVTQRIENGSGGN